MRSAPWAALIPAVPLLIVWIKVFLATSGQRGRAAETGSAGQVTSAARGNLRRQNLAKTPDRAQHLLLRQPWPLAAHDEVIDTEQLAIARDLFFY